MTDPQDSPERMRQNLTALHQRVRLYRLAKELGVSVELLGRLKPTLGDASRPAARKESAARVPAESVTAPEAAKAARAQEARAQEATAQEAPAVAPANEQQGSERQRVESLALAKGVADKAAQFSQYADWLQDHYRDLDSFVRERIIGCFAADELPPFIATVPKVERSGLEHLAIYLQKRAAADEPAASAALEYALEHQGELLSVLQTDTACFGLLVDDIALSWAELMLAKGWQKQGFAVLTTIPSTRGGEPNPSYHQAIMLAAKYRDEKSTSELVSRLRNQYDPKLKRQQLSFWLKKAQPAATKPTAKALWLRGSLQPLFADLFSTFERHPTSLSQLADLLIDHQQMLPAMPYLWDTLKLASLKFMTPSLTHALWRRFSELRTTPDSHPVVLGVVAAAKLQMFLLDTSRDEAGVWWAKAQLDKPAVAKAMGRIAAGLGTENEGAKTSPLSWNAIASKWLASLDTPHRRTIEGRDYLKAFVRITLAAPLSASQFQHYLRLAVSPAEASLTAVLRRCSPGFPWRKTPDELEHKSQVKSLPDVAIAAYARLILIRPLSNKELDDWLRLTENSQHLDLAWRLTTVLKFRKVLSAPYNQAWPYSAENQNPAPLNPIEANELKGFFPYHPLAAKLLDGFVRAGPLLTALFGKAPAGLPPSSDPLALGELGITKEEQVWDEKCVGMLLDQLPKAAKDHQPFTPPLITSPSSTASDGRGRQWLIMYHRVCQFYGLARLEFHLSNLSALEERLVAGTCFAQGTSLVSAKAPEPQGQQGMSDGDSGASKVAAEAFFALSAEQKQQVRAFLALGRHFHSGAGEIWGQRMMILLTLIHLPSHYFALSILEEINSPLEAIRWAESMVLTRGYSELRLRLGLSGHIPFPKNLRNFARISPQLRY